MDSTQFGSHTDSLKIKSSEGQQSLLDRESMDNEDTHFPRPVQKGLNKGQVQAAKNGKGPRKSDPGALLASLGLEKENLSTTGRINLSMISASVQQLGLTSGKKAAILSRIMQLRSQQWEVEDSQVRAEDLRMRLQGQIQELRKGMADLEGVSDSVTQIHAAKEAELADKSQKKVRWEAKAEGYVEEIRSLLAKLKKAGFQEELRHEKLKERQEALCAKQERAAALQARLEEYKGMPPDLDAARELYREKAQQLQETSKQFEDGLAQLN